MYVKYELETKLFPPSLRGIFPSSSLKAYVVIRKDVLCDTVPDQVPCANVQSVWRVSFNLCISVFLPPTSVVGGQFF